MTAQKQSIIIIGAGIGGLFCGAILSKEGYHVRVFEQHSQIGGGLHQFKRKGVSFETGIHVVGAFYTGGMLNRICSYLGIMDKLSILDTDNDCFERFYIGCDQKQYLMPKGYHHFIETLSLEFPEEKENIIRYMQALYAICDEVKLYNLEYSENPYQEHSEIFRMSVGDFIDSFTKNERLRSILALSNPLYAGEQYKTPVYIHALISKFYIEGASRFIGGSQQLSDALVEVIRGQRGEVYAGKGVKHIEIEDKKIVYILTVDGEKHQAEQYISSIHPSSLFQLLDTSKLQRSYWQRIDSIPNSYSAFTLYIIFKSNTFPFLNYTGYYQDDYSMTWTHDDYTLDTWPKGMMFITPPKTGQDVCAEKMIVNCVMNFDTVRQWENTTTGKRGKEYGIFKKSCEDKIIRQLETVFPNIRTCIQSIYSASPLTIRDYYNQKEGSLYGVKKDCNNMALSHISVRTKLGNLLLTGQNINLHGILGVSLTAINTCAELLGMEYLLRKINDVSEKYISLQKEWKNRE